MRQQPLALNRVHHRDSNGASQRPTAKCGAMQTWLYAMRNLIGAQDRPQRKPGGQRLRNCDDIGLDAEMLIGEPAPSATEATLDLIGDQHRAGFPGQLARAGEKVSAQRADSALTLHWFQQNGADALIKLALKVSNAVVLDEAHARHQRAERLAVFPGRGCCQRAERPPMK